MINNEKIEWQQQYISGAEVRNLGNIPLEDKIFLAIKRPWEDEPISDDTKIDLARPGLEKFYSLKHDNHEPFKIIVNGKEKSWSERTITYEQVIKLAFDSYVENDSTIYTVNYIDGPAQNPEGSMVKGSKVIIKNKMIFNVTATNRS